MMLNGTFDAQCLTCGGMTHIRFGGESCGWCKRGHLAAWDANDRRVFLVPTEDAWGGSFAWVSEATMRDRLKLLSGDLSKDRSE